ncbi:hypothetical protein BT96DRAFT_988629 [Gymnopus androsaceus JB14]|uniref:Uncharacterized protein n=1 Tax=Gymnopus androsaceus JB14 TaxID=1447944 RepID=A0A6A4I3P2_9AGAR|nr:hypothetical protein BT96DRAFT_988629 [Gymnopus androsaceus JB14]
MPKSTRLNLNPLCVAPSSASHPIHLFMIVVTNFGKVAYTVDDGSAVKIITVHVDDTARAYLLAPRKGKAGEAYNVTYETDIRSKNMKVKAGEWLVWFITAENRESNAKAKKELGWELEEREILKEVTLCTNLK